MALDCVKPAGPPVALRQSGWRVDRFIAAKLASMRPAKIRAAGTGLAAAMLVMVAACATLNVGSDYDKGANFAAYHTFAFMPREHHGTQNPLVAQRAQDDIKAELIRRGYSYTENATSADFLVDYTIGSKERTDVTTYPQPYVGGWWGFGGWWGPYWGNDVDVRQYREGTLSIDLFDGRTHRPVWHGWAKKELSRKDIEQSDEPIRRAVDAVLAKFPPSGTS